MMSKHELQGCPQWLLDADTENEDVEIIDGVLHWLGGVWHGGVWRDGMWHDGVWYAGVWHGGKWHDGVWLGGVWRGGEWHDGVWLGGVWLGGVWRYGVWHDDEWCGGKWVTGVWHDGVWRGGYRVIGFCKRKVFYDHIRGVVKIGCEERSVSDWEIFFASEEELNTKRGTDDFDMIYKSFLSAKSVIEIERG